MRFLEESFVKLNSDAESAEEAIRFAGQLLVINGAVEGRYIDAMINSFHKNGPYFALAPGIAMPHARPEDGVKEASVSMLQLRNPVIFGHSTNDPVRLVFALGASSSNEHLEVLQKLMVLLGNQDNVDTLLKATSYADVKAIVSNM